MRAFGAFWSEKQMLIGNSMSSLWMIYIALSLVVLLTGYLGLAFLPRLPRLVITWAVAGVMWMPAAFELPLTDDGEVYRGEAPGVMVAAVAFVEHNAVVLAGSGMKVVFAAVLGALFGIVLWWFGHKRRVRRAEEARAQARREQSHGEDEPSVSRSKDGRREPVLGQ